MTDASNTIRVVARALVLHLIVFLVVVHVLVFWKMDSGNVEGDIPEVPWYNSTDYENEFDRLLKLTSNLEKQVVKMQLQQNKVKTLMKKMDQVTHELERGTARVQENSSSYDTWLFIDAKPGNYHEPSRLRELLQVEDLEVTHPLETTLRPAFREATADLQKNMQLAMHVDWPALRAVFDSFETPVRPLVEVVPPGECEKLMEDADQDEKRVDAADLQQLLDRARGHLEKRWKLLDSGLRKHRLPFAFEETTHRQHKIRDQLLDELEAERQRIALERQIAAAASNQQANGVQADSTFEHVRCVKSQEVLPWVEAGLDSYYKGQDLRQGILRALLEADPSFDASDVILDAPLTEVEAPRRSEPENLRQMLDGPLVLQGAVWINTLIDLLGGYNDRLDQLIDESGVDDVGKAAMGFIMEKAGTIKLPPLPEFVLKHRRKAGMLLAPSMG